MNQHYFVMLVLQVCALAYFAVAQNATTNAPTTATIPTSNQCNETNNEEYVNCTQCIGTCQTPGNLSAEATPGCACKDGYILDESSKECLSWADSYSKCNTSSTDGITIIIITHILSCNISDANDASDGNDTAIILVEFSDNGAQVDNTTFIATTIMPDLSENTTLSENDTQTDAPTTISVENTSEDSNTTTVTTKEPDATAGVDVEAPENGTATADTGVTETGAGANATTGGGDGSAGASSGVTDDEALANATVNGNGTHTGSDASVTDDAAAVANATVSDGTESIGSGADINPSGTNTTANVEDVSANTTAKARAKRSITYTADSKIKTLYDNGIVYPFQFMVNKQKVTID